MLSGVDAVLFVGLLIVVALEVKVSAEVDALKAQSVALTNAVNSAVAALGTPSSLPAADLATIVSVTADLKTNTDALSAAVAAKG